MEIRAFKEGEKRYIVGWASRYNQQSRTLRSNGRLFREVIEDRAFDEVLASENLNVIANINHDDGQMLARSIVPLPIISEP